MFLFLLFLNSSFGETRIYKYEGPIQELVNNFIDELINSGVKFQIKKNYSEVTDGKLGFSAIVLPGKRIIDIQFFDGNQKITFIKLFYENEEEGKIFHEILLKTKCEENSTPVLDDSLPPGWPKIN